MSSNKVIEKVKLIWVTYNEVPIIRELYSTKENPIKMCSWGGDTLPMKFGFYVKEELLNTIGDYK